MANDANEVTFSVKETGETSKEQMVGDFVTKKRLSHRDHLRKDALRRDLLGAAGGVPTERAMSTSMIISELAVRVIKGPTWWTESDNGLDLVDDNVIGAIYDAATKHIRDEETKKIKEAEKAAAELKKEAEAKAKDEAEDLK